MKLLFDIDKSIAATARLLQKSHGSKTVLFVIKMLYDADREALVKWHRTITGDDPVSMDNGPVLSRIYNLTKGKGAKSHLEAWNRVFQPREGHALKLQPETDVDALLDNLSDREIDALDKSFEKVERVKGRIADWAHKHFPEWEDPQSSSKPIDFAKVLALEGLSDDQVSKIVAEIDSVQSARRALKAV